jgi:hypothetical protein
MATAFYDETGVILVNVLPREISKLSLVYCNTKKSECLPLSSQSHRKIVRSVASRRHTSVSITDIIKKFVQTLLLHLPHSAHLTVTFSPDRSFERLVVRTPLQDDEALKNAMSQQLEKMKNVFHWLGTHALV